MVRHIYSWPGLVALLIGPTVANLDATMMNIALPNFQHAFHLSLDEVSWALHAYNIGLAMGLMPAGRLADQFGRKRLFCLGLLVFGIGTLWCSLLYAPALPALFQTSFWFFLARGVQGVGAAALLAAGLAAALTMSKSAPLWWAVASSLAIAIGPILGGLLLQWLCWRWIFWVNLPPVVISAVLCRDVPESRDGAATRQIDWPGMVLLAALLSLLIRAVLEGDQPNLWWWEGAIVALLLFLLVEVWHPAAVLDVSLFRARSFRRVTCLLLVFSVALMAAFVVFALFLRVAHSVTEAAFLLLPISTAGLVVSLWLASPCKPCLPTWQMALFGLLCLAAGLLCYRLFPSYTPPLWLLLVADTLVGAGMGFCFSSLNAMGVADVAHAQLGIASGMLSLMQQCGYTIGTAVLILLVQRQGGVVLGSFQKTWWEAALCVVGTALWLWWTTKGRS